MFRFALNSLESVVRLSIYISIISSDMQNSYYGFCGTFLEERLRRDKISIFFRVDLAHCARRTHPKDGPLFTSLVRVKLRG